MWERIRTITDYKSNSVCPHGVDKVDNIMTSAIIPAVETEQTLTLSTHEVQYTLWMINPRKAAGPYEVPGQVLKDCAGQLSEIFEYLQPVPSAGKSPQVSKISYHSTSTKESKHQQFE